MKTNLLFFTKGKPTERIWYYDLSDVKVGKKSPLTLNHFEDFAGKLAIRADSDRSWTVDLAARRANAAEEALPFREMSREKTREADRAKDELGELKKAKPRDEAAIADAEATVRDLLKQGREATSKAEDIDNAVYDLKAVNPHRKAEIDRRTPAELFDLVEATGLEIAEGDEGAEGVDFVTAVAYTQFIVIPPPPLGAGCETGRKAGFSVCALSNGSEIQSRFSTAKSVQQAPDAERSLDSAKGLTFSGRLQTLGRHFTTEGKERGDATDESRSANRCYSSFHGPPLDHVRGHGSARAAA